MDTQTTFSSLKTKQRTRSTWSVKRYTFMKSMDTAWIIIIIVQQESSNTLYVNNVKCAL